MKGRIVILLAILCEYAVANSYNVFNNEQTQCACYEQCSESRTNVPNTIFQDDATMCKYGELSWVKKGLENTKLRIDKRIKIIDEYMESGKFMRPDRIRINKCGVGARYLGNLEDSAFTASSVHRNSERRQPYYARLDMPSSQESDGGWLMNGPFRRRIGQEYIEVDLGTAKTVTGVVTQGQANGDAWVITYQVRFGYHSNSYMTIVHDEFWEDKIFEGNTNSYDIVVGNFPIWANARYIRIYPLSYHNKPVMRLEILTC